MLISEKTNELIPRKLTDRRMDGRTDGQSLFYSTLPAEAGAPKKTFFFGTRFYIQISSFYIEVDTALRL